MKTPAVPLCLAFVAGTLLPPAASMLAVLSLAASLLVSTLACVGTARLRAASALVLAAFAALGTAATTFHRDAVEHSTRVMRERLHSGPAWITARLRREPEASRFSTRLVVDAERLVQNERDERFRGGLRVSVHGEHRAHLDELAAFDRVRFWATLHEPRNFRNLGSFDGEAYLERQHIVGSGSVKSGLLVRTSSRSFSPRALVSRGRIRALRVLESMLPDPQTYGVVAALVTGSRADLSTELEALYQRAGIFHVMAISGAHVAVWILCAHAGLRFLGLDRRATFKVLLVVLPAYAMFCGGRPPVVRAVVMAIVWIGADLASVRTPRLNGLAVAVLCLLAWEPASLGDAGFQLTVAAMASILAFYEPLAFRLQRVGRVGPPLAVSLAAQIGTLPIAAWHFHRIHPGSSLASLLAMPIAATVGVLGVLLLATSGVPWLADAVAALTQLAASALTGLATLASTLPGASIRVAAPSALFLVLYAVAALAACRGPTRLRRAGGVCLLGLVGSMLVSLPSRPGALEVTALDVGHGDALVVALPEGGAVLVDAGGLPRSSLDTGASVVVPYLLDRGLAELHAVVLTHADYDHVGGLPAVLRELGAESVWEGAPDRERAVYRAVAARARERGIPFRVLRAGERIELGGAVFEVLSAGSSRSPDANNRSVVLAVEFAGRRVLLTGDAERELEQSLLRSGVNLRADILKVAHHGSRSSTTEAFLDAVRPKFAVISARENRSRPIPSPRVLDRLRARGIQYARTDEAGAVTVRIDAGGGIEITTFEAMGEPVWRE